MSGHAARSWIAGIAASLLVPLALAVVPPAASALATTMAPLAVTASSLPAATAGTSYSTTLKASGGIKPYIWSQVDGSLPPGLVLHPTGQINGDPVGPAGTYTFDVQVTDQESPAAAVTAAESITVSVTPLTVTTVSLPPATAGVAYSAKLAAAGGVSPYSWSMPSGSLPAGLTLHSTTGVISGTPKAGGSSTFDVEVTDAEAAPQVSDASQSITVSVAGLIVTAASALPTVTSGMPYSVKLAAAGGITPYQWSLAAGSLPTGLKLAKSTGVLSGTTSVTGPDSFTVQVTDAEVPAAAATENVSLLVVDPMVVPTGLSDAIVAEQYDAPLQPGGGLGPFTYAISAGSLPPGLALQPDGEITGQATADGSSSFTVSVTDSENPPATATQAESITVIGGPVVFNPAALQGENVGTSADQPLIASGGVQPFTVTTTGTVPPGQQVDQTGELTGTPTAGGDYQFTVQVTDSSSPPQTVSQTFTVTVQAAPPLLASSGALPEGYVGSDGESSPYGPPDEGEAYDGGYGPTVSGGVPPYTMSLASGTLPPGLVIFNQAGFTGQSDFIGGWATQEGTYGFSLTITDSIGDSVTVPESITIGPSPAPTTTSLPAAILGQPYSFTFTGTGGAGGPYTFQQAGAPLPVGLTMDPSGVISGTPRATASNLDFAVRVDDAADNYFITFVHITVVDPLTATSGVLADGVNGSYYADGPTISGGQGPYTMSLASGTLPPGLAIDYVNQAIDGYPTADGTYDFSVTITDLSGESVTVDEQITIVDS